MTLDTFTILSSAALHDAFGFGQTRCQRFMDKVLERIDRKSRAVNRRIRNHRCEKRFNSVYGGRAGKNCTEENPMNKMREYERGREDGLILALRIARQGGG